MLRRLDRHAVAVIVAMGLVYVIWGSTYLAIRVSVDTIPPFLSTGTRFLISGVLLLGALALAGRIRAIPTRRESAGAALMGVWLLAGGVGLVTLGETEVPSNLAAVLASTASIWVVMYRLVAGERLSPLAAAGIVVGFAGVAILLLWGRSGASAGIGWLALCVLGSLFWSSGSFYGRRLPAPRDPFLASGVQMLAAGTAMTVASLVTGEAFDVDPDAISLESAAAVAYLVVLGLIAFTAYVWLLGQLPISTIVTHQYVNPVVAVTLGWLLLSEPVGVPMLVGAALVVGAVVAIVRAEART